MANALAVKGRDSPVRLRTLTPCLFSIMEVHLFRNQMVAVRSRVEARKPSTYYAKDQPMIKYLVAIMFLMLLPTPAFGVDNTDVLYVHGYINSPGCPGIDTAKQALPLSNVLKTNGYAGKVIGVDWLCGDKNGVNIKPYGRIPASSFNANAHIDDVCYAFANYVKTVYNANGKTPNVVAHSMGGLITSCAAKTYGAVFNKVVTISTPYGGLDESLPLDCSLYTQCKEMVPGSAFLTDLRNKVKPSGITWTTIGGSPRDIMSYGSSSGTDATTKVNYYATTPVNYGHSAYLTDTSTAKNVPVRINDVATTGYHSLQTAYLYIKG